MEAKKGRYVDETDFNWWQRLKRRAGICPLDGGYLEDYYGHGVSLKCSRQPHTYRAVPAKR